MDADIAAMQRFAEAGYVIEAPAPQAGLANAAASALAKTGVRVTMQAPRHMADDRYAAMVEDIRRTIQAELTPHKGYEIKVLDASARNMSKELAKADPSLRNSVGEVNKFFRTKGAFSTGFEMKGKGMGCLVAGLKPEISVDFLMDYTTGAPGAPRMGLTNEVVHRISLMHEVGHCLLGVSEAKADTFSALMLLRDTDVPKSALAFWASWREKMEWTSLQLDDDHFTAKSVWTVVERADALRADPDFKRMSAEEIANLASQMVDRLGQTLPEELEAVSVRRAVRAGIAKVSPQGAKAFGFEPLTQWLVDHQDIPEAARILSLVANMEAGVEPMQPFETKPGSFRERLGELAKDGDPVAMAMAKAYDETPKPSFHGIPTFVAKIPYRYAETAFTAKAVAFDPACDIRLPEMEREGAARRVEAGFIPLGDERDPPPVPEIPYGTPAFR